MVEITVPRWTRTSPPSTWPGGPLEGWLASAHPTPSTVQNEWGSAAKLALLPLRHAFEAVRLPEDVVHGAAGSDAPSVVRASLAQYLDGPVIHDPGFARYYALVPPGTAKQWLAPGVECLGEGTYLGVPRTDRTERDEETRASYWVVPMARPGALCKAGDVLALVMAGGCLAEEDES